MRVNSVSKTRKVFHRGFSPNACAAGAERTTNDDFAWDNVRTKYTTAEIGHFHRETLPYLSGWLCAALFQLDCHVTKPIAAQFVRNRLTSALRELWLAFYRIYSTDSQLISGLLGDPHCGGVHLLNDEALAFRAFAQLDVFSLNSIYGFIHQLLSDVDAFHNVLCETRSTHRKKGNSLWLPSQAGIDAVASIHERCHLLDEREMAVGALVRYSSGADGQKTLERPTNCLFFLGRSLIRPHFATSDLFRVVRSKIIPYGHLRVDAGSEAINNPHASVLLTMDALLALQQQGFSLYFDNSTAAGSLELAIRSTIQSRLSKPEQQPVTQSTEE